MQCKRHPNVETNLTCGKCGDPICPRCMVQTPVGARCPKCARMSRVPTYNVSTIYYLRAIGTGLGVAVVLGIAWAFLLRSFSYFGFFDLIIAGAIGYAIGESISWAANRKAGTGLAIIGGGSFLLCYLVSAFAFRGGFFFGLFDILIIIVGIFVAVARLR